MSCNCSSPCCGGENGTSCGCGTNGGSGGNGPGVCTSNPCSTSRNIAGIHADQSPAAGTDCTPIYPEVSPLEQRSFRPCTDPNGCNGLFPVECRDGYWPCFTHPRWLCCRDLYNAAV